MQTYKEMAKQYIGLITDHSASMYDIADAAMKDYNANISALCEETNKHQLDTIIYTILCGYGKGSFWFGDNKGYERAVVNSTVSLLQPLTEYSTKGDGTPLYDSIGELITLMERVPDADSPNVSFLTIVVTDGLENCSKIWKHKLKEKILALQKTDRWTFTFRVPPGYSTKLQRELGVPEGNFYEWNTSVQGMKASQVATKAAVQQYYTNRSVGKTSTQSFYTDLSNVSVSEVKQKLSDITSQIQVFAVTPNFHDFEIRDFVKSRRKGPFVMGSGFYELMKRERVQESKQVVLEDLKNKKFYGGQEARTMLGLPPTGATNVNPGDHGDFKIFIQSTSVNRKLKKNTQLVVWKGALRA